MKARLSLGSFRGAHSFLRNDLSVENVKRSAEAAARCAVRCPPMSGDLQRFDVTDLRLEGLCSVPEIHCTLRVEPKFGRIAEQT